MYVGEIKSNTNGQWHWYYKDVRTMMMGVVIGNLANQNLSAIDNRLSDKLKRYNISHKRITPDSATAHHAVCLNLIKG